MSMSENPAAPWSTDPDPDHVAPTFLADRLLRLAGALVEREPYAASDLSSVAVSVARLERRCRELAMASAARTVVQVAAMPWIGTKRPGICARPNL